MITVVMKGRLLDCKGDEPFEDASVVIEDGIIKDVYSGKRPLPECRIIDVGGRTILPGLTDAHIHPSITKIDARAGLMDPPIVQAIKMKDNLERILQGGYTTIRVMGISNSLLKQAVADGLIKGPRMLVCNHGLCQIGGAFDFSIRGDFSGLPKDDKLVSIGRIVNGADDARKATREQFRAGADHIKVFVSGSPGCGTPEARDQQELTNGELQAIIEEANARSKYVGAHATNTLAIERAINAGVKSVEHGFGLTEELAQMMREKGVFLVPTILMYDLIARHGKEWGAPEVVIRESAGSVIEEQLDAIRIAHQRGVDIAPGSDCFAELCGYEGMTIPWLVKAGLTPYEAIKSATIIGARLFRMENEIGSIEVGKCADIIVVDGHPDEDAGVLAKPTNIRLVMKKGGIFKLNL